MSAERHKQAALEPQAWGSDVSAEPKIDCHCHVFDPARFTSMRYRMIGPARGGQVVSIPFEHERSTTKLVERIRAGEIDVVVNTPQGSGARTDGYDIRTAAVAADIPCITTLSGLTAVVQGIEALLAGDLAVRPLQAWHEGPAGGRSGPSPPDGGGGAPAGREVGGR